MRTYWLPAALTAALGVAACQPSTTPKTPRTPTTNQVMQVPSMPDVQFATSVRGLLENGKRSPQRDTLLTQAVQAQFRHARRRFEADDQSSGLQATMGALYLIRAGEFQPGMLNQDAAAAMEYAYRAVAPRGDEGASRAFLTLQLLSLHPQSPQHAVIQKRLGVLAKWIQDTRGRSNVEDAATDVIADGTSATLNPTKEEIDRARASVERWISASMKLHDNFDAIRATLTRDMVVDASRALRVGPVTMAALYLRNGDASGAIQAVEQTKARPLTSPALLDALQKAEAGDAQTWRDLAGLYANDATSTSGSGLVPKAIARGALWGCTLQSYRLAPTSAASTLALATNLETLGMPEVATAVLSKSMANTRDPATLSKALDLTLAILREENAHQNDDALQRAFTAVQPLLTVADGVQQSAQLTPTPTTIRRSVAFMDISAAHLDQAAWLLRQVVRSEPSPRDYLALARIANQTPGQLTQVQQYAQQGLALPGTTNPLIAVELHLLLFRSLRDAGQPDKARLHLDQASKLVNSTLHMRLNPASKAATLRLLARVAYFSHDASAWKHATREVAQLSSLGPSAVSISVVAFTSLAMLQKDPDTAEEIISRLAQTASPEDLAYAGLWTMFARMRSGGSASKQALDALRSVTREAGWPYWLAQWGLGKINDNALRQHARTAPQQTEASFYIGLRDFFAGKIVGAETLKKIAAGPHIDLVETFLAQELTRRATP